MAVLTAVTFDLWDTIVIDDSDEAVRAQQGLRTKRDERRHLLWDALNKIVATELAEANLAYDVADAAFNRVWHEQHVTWTIRERLDVILRGLGRELPESVMDDVVHHHETMELEIPPRLIEGCAAALAELSQKYKLAIVSDAIVTPGRYLRQILQNHGVLRYFNAFAFSDEVGHSKPHRDMFVTVAAQLGVQLDQIVHIGDRDHNDIQGAHQHGLRAILFTASRDVDREGSRPDAHCGSFHELVGIVDQLARSV